MGNCGGMGQGRGVAHNDVLKLTVTVFASTPASFMRCMTSVAPSTSPCATFVLSKDVYVHVSASTPAVGKVRARGGGMARGGEAGGRRDRGASLGASLQVKECGDGAWGGGRMERGGGGGR